MGYVLAKIVHVFAVVLWIGPPLGAYYLVFRAYQEAVPGNDREGAPGSLARLVWVERHTEHVLRLEHAAFAALIISGLFMVYATGWNYLRAGWLQWKLGLFGLVLVFEMFDMWVSHRLLRRVLGAGNPKTHPQWSKAERARWWLVVLGAPVGMLLVPAIVVLAVAKF